MKLLKITSIFIVLLSVLLISCENPFNHEPSLKCKVSLEINNSDLEVGDSTQVMANVSSPNGSTCDSGVDWKIDIDNEEIISITKIDKYTASIKALEEGDVSVIARSVDDSQAFDEINVNVSFTPIMVFGYLYGLDSKIMTMNSSKTTQTLIEHYYPDDPYLQEFLGNWLPDGERISFSSNREGNRFNIYTMDLSGENVKKITDVHYVTRHDWSSNGRKLVSSIREYKSGIPNEIYTYDLSNDILKRLTFEFSETQQVAKIPHNSRWSPNDEKILFTTARNGDWEIFIMNSDGTNQINLTNTPNYTDDAARWSPNGEKIVFTRRPRGIQSNNIWLMNSDGSNQNQLTTYSENYTTFSPMWSPDGEYIFFLKRASDGGRSEVWTIKTDGSELEKFWKLENEEPFGIPHWRPGIEFNWKEL